MALRGIGVKATYNVRVLEGHAARMEDANTGKTCRNCKIGRLHHTHGQRPITLGAYTTRSFPSNSSLQGRLAESSVDIFSLGTRVVDHLAPSATKLALLVLRRSRALSVALLKTEWHHICALLRREGDSERDSAHDTKAWQYSVLCGYRLPCCPPPHHSPSTAHGPATHHSCGQRKRCREQYLQCWKHRRELHYQHHPVRARERYTLYPWLTENADFQHLQEKG